MSEVYSQMSLSDSFIISGIFTQLALPVPESRLVFGTIHLFLLTFDLVQFKDADQDYAM